MANLISQLRNQTQTQTPTAQLSLNNSINNIRQVMQQLQLASNPQAMLRDIIVQNPQLSAMLANSNNLEQIARNMASVSGINIEQLINQLLGGVQSEHN